MVVDGITIRVAMLVALDHSTNSEHWNATWSHAHAHGCENCEDVRGFFVLVLALMEETSQS